MSAIRQKLAGKVGKERYELWFCDRVLMDLDGETLRVQAPDSFWVDRLRNHFRQELAAAAEDVLGGPVTLQFRCHGRPAKQTPAAAPRERNRLLWDDMDEAVDESPPARGQAAPAISAKQTAAAKPKRELKFITGICNQLANASAQMSLENLGRFSPLFLYGPTGCGKSHLLAAIQRMARKRLRSGRVVLLSAEQFTSIFLEALQGSGLPNFRRKYRDLDVLLIDDVHFFAGKRATLTELHHTLDSLVRSGKQVVFAADRSPVELNGLGPDLTARMSGGIVSAMEPLDESTRLGVLESLAKQYGVAASNEVLAYLAAHLPGDARRLRGALNRLDASNRALGEPISRDLAERTLRDLFQATQRAVKLCDIEQAVCDVFGLNRQELQSPRKSKSVSHPRMLAMWLARKHTRAAFSEIGDYFGRRTHSTVISAQKKIGSWLDTGEPIRMANGDCDIRDAVRRIESQLRAV
ncbi:MAG: DnaA/Hda family protein [Pirellulaceae bacterium]|nr:DnaA/Hda family protein [Pirellulaceae bacterium]